MDEHVDATGAAPGSRAGAVLGWDDVFGLHLLVRGSAEEALRIADELTDVDIEAVVGGADAGRLRRDGGEVVLLCVPNRNEESEVRALLNENGRRVEPPSGTSDVPPPYGERLRPLLTWGSHFNEVKPPGAAELGLTVADGPELLRVAVDPEFDATYLDDAAWAPAWAWFLLGELNPPGASATLLGLLDRLDREDGDEAAALILPKAFGRIGPEVAPALVAVLRDEARKSGPRWAAVDGLKEIALARPETRAEMVRILTAQLEERAVRDETINAAIIGDLIDLKAVESAAVIDRAFADGRVDESVAGDRDDVQVSLGLKTPVLRATGLGWADATPAPVKREGPKVGRNDPCPCGSRKKFKKCCGG